ncbi:unnamed protein product [Sphagnum balticum]
MGLSFGRQSSQTVVGGEDDVRSFYARVHTDDDIEQAIRALLAVMSQREKIGQLTQISYGDKDISLHIQNAVINGEVGSFLNCNGVVTINELQRLAMEKSRLKIPQLIGKDVIHGFRTVLPIPLAQAASFDPELVRQCARNAAEEASSTGIRWTFSPMVDIARDPRWGRIAEGCGEDPYLASVMGVAMCKGYQTDNLKDITAIAACGKHYVGYGASEGGRDYNTTLIPENTLRDIYLSPFQALALNGCLSYMSGFNDLNGEPSSGNDFTLKQVLRKEWGFTGLVVSDYTAISEMIVHSFCENEKDAALKAFNGGVDMEMVSSCYKNYLSTLVSEGKVRQSDIDTAVGNVLRVKFKLGLFENPYTDPSRQSIILNEKFKQQAKELAVKSAVLLQNKNKTLPISNGIKNLAIIGALADDGDNQMGCWVPDGQAKDSITPLTSLKAALSTTNIMFAKGRPLVLTPYLDQVDSIFYNAIRIEQAKLSSDEMGFGDTIVASTLVTNEDEEFSSDSPVMLYIRDKVGSYTRPLIELKGFQRDVIEADPQILLNPGADYPRSTAVAAATALDHRRREPAEPTRQLQLCEIGSSIGAVRGEVAPREAPDGIRTAGERNA